MVMESLFFPVPLQRRRTLRTVVLTISDINDQGRFVLDKLKKLLRKKIKIDIDLSD